MNMPKDMAAFLVSNIADILLFSAFIFFCIKAVLSTVLKELISFLGVLTAFIVAWNFHQNKPDIFIEFGLTTSTSRLLLFLAVFFLIISIVGLVQFIIELPAEKRKNTILTLPVKLILSALSFIIWLNVVYIIINRYIPAITEYTSMSRMDYYIVIINDVIQGLYKRFFEFF